MQIFDLKRIPIAMKKIIRLTIVLLAVLQIAGAQVTLRGRVTDDKGISLPGANILLQGTYDGASADTGGYFKFRTAESGQQILVASFIGYKTITKEINLADVSQPINVVLEEQSGEIKGVVITAGAFETGELKRPIVLKTMDIATTPSAAGDIYGALTTLPGAQVVGNEGGLYVRGGEGYETKTYIDGMYVANPYQSKMPDLPTRCRFSPILFTGTAFSTGGYSAEYGQALSSVINLNTSGIADKSQGAVAVMSVGLSGSYTQAWGKGSLAGTVQYLNMGPYYSMFKQEMSWKDPPVQWGGTLLFRQKFGRYGLLKVFGSFDRNNSALNYRVAGDSAEPSVIRLQTANYYLNAVYSDVLTEKWRFKTGFSTSFDNNLTGTSGVRMPESLTSFHHRMTLTHELNDNISLKFGEEALWNTFNRSYILNGDSAMTLNYGVQLREYALYAEPEFRIKGKFVARIGIRSEYVSLLQHWQLVPRISVAFHTGDYSQLSLAYGLFRQRPEYQYLIYSPDLQSERATHLILNYQYEVDKRIFRAELYRKWYGNLVKFDAEYNPDPAMYSNTGSGYAQGIDLFWRDSKTIRDLDYWLSYSYIDTRRNYKNFRESLVPSFISPHTFSLVMKYFIRKANTYTGLTYVYASPKTCYNPAAPVSPGNITRAYNDLSLNVTCIRPLLGTYCAILLNVSNVLGFNNVFGYHYAANPDQSGHYAMYPIKPQSKRFFIVAVYLIL